MELLLTVVSLVIVIIIALFILSRGAAYVRGRGDQEATKRDLHERLDDTIREFRNFVEQFSRSREAAKVEDGPDFIGYLGECAAGLTRKYYEGRSAESYSDQTLRDTLAFYLHQILQGKCTTQFANAKLSRPIVRATAKRRLARAMITAWRRGGSLPDDDEEPDQAHKQVALTADGR